MIKEDSNGGVERECLNAWEGEGRERWRESRRRERLRKTGKEERKKGLTKGETKRRREGEIIRIPQNKK